MLYINGVEYCFSDNNLSKTDIAKFLNVSTSEFYLLSNGKRINEVNNLESCRVEVVLRLPGGKGGFGSMLRAIGAQIEKTTNREACRDLSGRRLRDINEEKRLKAWIGQQADRDKAGEDRRKKRLERLCQKPKHEFKDELYEKERSELTDRLEDALEHGLKKDKGKRKSAETVTTQKKKRCIMLGSDEEISSTDEEAEEEKDEDKSKPSTSKINNENIINIDEPQTLSENENSDSNEGEKLQDSAEKIDEKETKPDEKEN